LKAKDVSSTHDGGRPSAARRLLTGLASLGLDLRPFLRRCRDAMLRPVRNEIALDKTILHEQLSRRQAEVASALAQIESRLTDIATRQRAGETLGAELGDGLSRLEALLQEISAVQRGSERLAADLGAGLSRLEAELQDMSARQRASETLGADLGARLSRLDDRLSDTVARMTAERSDRQARQITLERLLTEIPQLRSAAGEGRIKEWSSPIVSVILPTRNRAHAVGDAIASVLAQHFTDWELIIVDDGGGADGTPAVVSPYLADRRIRCIESPAAGAAAARNRGLKAARGELIAYLDSDNVWYPDFLAAAVNELAADPAVDMVYGVLVSDDHRLDGTRLLWEPFDRRRLLAGNYIDLNVVVHRRSMVERYGGFDEGLSRLIDWDLLLRYTEHAPARPLPVLAARYRVRDDNRISTTVPLGDNLLTIRRKWYPPPAATRRPRVLYAIWQYPQLSETYIESEIRCMLRWGVHAEVWRKRAPTSPHPPSVPIHDGSLVDAVHRVQPDIIHIHWVGFVTMQAQTLAQLGVPVTVRLHGFDTTPDSGRALLALPWVRAVYGFPHHLSLIERAHPKLRGVPAVFDTTLFRPHAEKDRRMVLRASAALPSKELPFFFELAKRLPDYRFVLAAITCSDSESYPESLRDLHRQTNSPCQLLFDVQHDELAPLMAQAGIYVHTAKPPGTEHGTPIGMPVSIAEAMATGAYVLVRDLPELRDYVGPAGAVYRDVDDAAKIIAATASWPEQAWKRAWLTATDRAFTRHADEVALRPIFEDWCALVAERAQP
jgi:glycosyltransferase involved in cell wall biosynthesis